MSHSREKPVRDTFLPFCLPFVGEEEKKAVLEALESGWISVGPKTKEFEGALASYLGAQHVAAVSSATAGLHLALVAADIGPGDEVITSPLTFTSTVSVILHVGATPVLADVDRETYCVSPEQVAARLTPRTRAILPVHYAGHPCEMDAIRDLASQKDLLIIEDAAHAIGTEYRGQLVGSCPESVTVFSFYATKNITTCEGGAVATGREDLIRRVERLRLHGISRDAWKRYSAAGNWFYEVQELGFKYNMTDIQAAMGLCQLRRLEGFIERRERICRRYDEAFGTFPEIVVPQVRGHVRHSRHVYTVQIDFEHLELDRNEFIEALRREGIGSSVLFIPIHYHPYYRQRLPYGRGDFPVTERLFERIVSLPLFPHMTDNDVEDVIRAVCRVISRSRKDAPGIVGGGSGS